MDQKIRAQVHRQMVSGAQPVSKISQHRCDKCKKRQNLQQDVTLHAPDSVPPIVHEVLHVSGQPLDPDIRAIMEPHFGHNFSRVRVHTDARASESAQAVNALAYTVGTSIVFGQGQYAPSTASGRRLLGHELAHVVQQDRDAHLRTVVQRKEDKPKSGGGIAASKTKGSTAGDAPKLELTPSKNGQPCACLVVVHNDERNARKTAELMHDHCSYNLALVQPDTGKRLIQLPGGSKKVDPNSLFPLEVAEQCVNDLQSCKDFLKANVGATNKSQIEKFVQMQFYLAINDCSNSFSLPVVALHNNDIEDTKNYLQGKAKAGVGELKMNIDKSKKETGEDLVKKLKDLIKDKFGESVKKEMIETPGKTNIFRWCAANDLSKCHIGDPDHPDNVVWVTKEDDFQKLSKKDVNVALQSDLPSSKGSESEGDLSTLFLIMRNIFGDKLVKLITERVQGNAVNPFNTIMLLFNILDTSNRLESLRYINIETPGKGLSDQTDVERIRNYEAIVEVLKTVGLHCCGDDPTKAEKGIKEGLKTEKKK